MVETTVSALIEGGEASAGPPLGPALGPTGVNVGRVVQEINQKTKDFEGVEVPVEIIIDSATKEFRLKVGTPPVSALLKKELGLENLYGADIPIDYIIKVARLKKDSMLSYEDKNAVKEVLGTCLSAKARVEGQDPREVQGEIEEGKYSGKISGEEELEFLSPQEVKELREKAEQEREAAEEALKEEKEEVEEVEEGEEIEEAEEKEELEEVPEEHIAPGQAVVLGKEKPKPTEEESEGEKSEGEK